MTLPTPAELKTEYPLSPEGMAFIAAARKTAKEILIRQDERKVAIVGPCSVHDPESILEYGKRLKKLSKEVEPHFFLVLRFFIEKSRTRLGWKGLLYDPGLDGSNDIASGLRLSRKLFIEMIEMGIPCATELLEPLVIPYFDDLIVWGMIGARTSASQPHRQMASGLPFPVGFKNGVHGELDVAISGILTSRLPHSHIGIDSNGKIASILSQGNPFTHLVLRGSEHQTNFDEASVAKAIRILQSQYLEPRLIIDCSHGNSGKDPQKQRIAFESVMEQKNPYIAGIMLESHLLRGKQSIDCSPLQMGLSITDPCMGWEETEALLKLELVCS